MPITKVVSEIPCLGRAWKSSPAGSRRHERRTPVSGHHRAPPARLSFPHPAAGGSCATPGADPVRSPLPEDPASGSGPEALSVRKSLMVCALSRMKRRSRG